MTELLNHKKNMCLESKVNNYLFGKIIDNSINHELIDLKDFATTMPNT